MIKKIQPFIQIGGWTAIHADYYLNFKRYYKCWEKRGDKRKLHDSVNVILYGCMTIEGMINHYGYKRLGGIWYKKIERMGITEKIPTIYAICFNELLDEDDEMIKEVRKLFDLRNSLVHPKTKSLNSENMFNEIIDENITKNSSRTIDIFKESLIKRDSTARYL